LQIIIIKKPINRIILKVNIRHQGKSVITNNPHKSTTFYSFHTSFSLSKFSLQIITNHKSPKSNTQFPQIISNQSRQIPTNSDQPIPNKALEGTGNEGAKIPFHFVLPFNNGGFGWMEGKWFIIFGVFRQNYPPRCFHSPLTVHH